VAFFARFDALWRSSAIAADATAPYRIQVWYQRHSNARKSVALHPLWHAIP